MRRSSSAGSRRGAWRSAALSALCLALFSACGQAPTGTADAEPVAETPPPGLEFVPPAPGTYELPVIQTAVDGIVLDADGAERRLFDYVGDRYVLLSFIYLNCTEAKGCPLANANLAMIRQDLEADPELASQVRLISLSFDPERDTPEAMLRHWGDSYLEVPWNERLWSLLTTPSRSKLQPILDGFGQYIVREVDEEGRETGSLSHVLKVFLIDRERRVRNVYSTSFLHPAIALNDLETLVMEDAGRG
ncbi:MAG TPA: SCO family protein [Chondromyces sp.]|nr:SCO family protein [Chondromyces sp.]